MSDSELSWGDFDNPMPLPRKIKRCKKCGTDHYVGDGCETCRKKRLAEWHQKNGVRIRIKTKEYSATHKAERRARLNKYRAEHLEEVRAKEKIWRDKNREKDKARKRENNIINPYSKSWEQKAAQRCNKRARQKHVPGGMKPADLYDSNTGILPVFCPIFPHIKLDYNAGSDMRCWASVDRKVPELGYTTENVWVISMAANTWKSNGSNPSERAKISKLMTQKKSKTKISESQIPLF